VPAYAATIHKSQGSEYPAVVIPVMTQHYAMLQRNLLYTGVTRGKRLVVLVGQKKAVAIAVRNISGRRRWSKLAEWLRSQAGLRVLKLLGGNFCRNRLANVGFKLAIMQSEPQIQLAFRLVRRQLGNQFAPTTDNNATPWD
jgi:hypothetical protein